MATNSMPLSHTLLLLLLLLLMAFTTTQEVAVAAPMRPLSTETRLLKSRLIDEGQRRRLGSFQICALCTCCGGPRGICLPSPCCYAINCNIPNRPFGFCSFTPKTCNCFGCHL